MSDQILPMPEFRIPSDQDDARRYCIERIEDIKRAAEAQMAPWIRHVAFLDRMRPLVVYLDPGQFNPHKQTP
jgi:hypothetical protein